MNTGWEEWHCPVSILPGELVSMEGVVAISQTSQRIRELLWDVLEKEGKKEK